MSDSDVRNRSLSAGPLSSLMGKYEYAIQTPSGIHRGTSEYNPDTLRAQGFSEQELTRILAGDPGPAPVRTGSKSDFQEAMTNWEMANEAWKQGQALLVGGPGSQGQVEFNKAPSGFSKYGGDWVPAITMLGGGAVIGGGIAAGGALGATEGTAAGTLGSTAGAGAVDYTSGAGLESVLGGGATPVAEGFSPFGPEEAATANPGGISDYPATPTTGVPGGPAVPSAGVGGAATGAAAGTALSRILDGKATNADYLSVLGTAGATGLGMYSANQREQTIRNELGQQRQDRAPYLAASQGWLADPNSYLSGPGQAAMGATLQGLSATHGNPIGSGTALALGNQAGLMNWQNAVTGLGNMGLSGADTRANLAMAGANAGADKWSTLAGGISDVVNPRKSLADYMKEYKLITA